MIHLMNSQTQPGVFIVSLTNVLRLPLMFLPMRELINGWLLSPHSPFGRSINSEAGREGSRKLSKASNGLSLPDTDSADPPQTPLTQPLLTASPHANPQSGSQQVLTMDSPEHLTVTPHMKQKAENQEFTVQKQFNESLQLSKQEREERRQERERKESESVI